MLNIIMQHGLIWLQIKAIEYRMPLRYLYSTLSSLGWVEIRCAAVYLVFFVYPIYWVKIAETSSCFHWHVKMFL